MKKPSNFTVLGFFVQINLFSKAISASMLDLKGIL